MPLHIILSFDSWHMMNMKAGPSRVTPTTSTLRRRVEDISQVRGEVSHVTTEDSVIDSIMGEIVPIVEPTAVS